MKKYRSPDGTIYTEDEAKKIFGTNFTFLIQDGQLQEIGEEVSISEISYKSPDGTVYSELQAREVFGNNFEFLIEDGQLQKQELDIEDIQNNALIVDNTIVDGIPFADLNFEEQSNYINRAGNYAENEKGDLLFLPKNRQEVDMTWNLPKDKSGRRYFPNQLTGGLFDEISEEEISAETIPPAPPRQGTRPNVDDQNNVVSESTHLMKAEQLEDGNWVAFPSLFQNLNGEWVDMSGEKNWEPIYQEALKRGEVIEFGKNKEAAIAYGEGSWKEKDTSPFPDLSLENLSTRGNRNENVEILSDYTIAKKPYSTVHVNGKRVLPANINKDAPNVAITIADETLNLLNINKQDYVNWERETLREESERFKTSQGLIRWDEGEKLAIEKRNAEKLSAYMITLSKGIEQDLDIVNAKLKFISDPVERAKLKAKREVLKQDLFNNLKGRIKLVETNDYLKNQKESEIEKNINIFNEGQEGGLSYILTETKNTLKSVWNVIPQFYGGILRMIASIPDQGLTLAGDDKKGVLSAIDEALGRVQEQLSFDIPQRSSFMGGKKVYSVVNGQNHPFIVTPEGQILDEITHVNMQGILTDQQYESILKNSKGEKSETFFSPGAFVPTAAYTIGNLFALIKSGKWATKTINKGLKKIGSKSEVPGGLGMGISSYASTAVGEVEDIRATLVRSGMSEKEAMKYAIAAGNSRATLDGIFSGLAGSNVKLLTSTKNMGKAIIDIAKKPSTWKVGGKFTTKTFEKKVKEFAKENFKEVFVEELPVLYSGKGINSIVNSLLEEDILDEKVKTAEVYETIAMTIAATSGIGSVNLLQGNSRSALVDLAATSPDLKKTIDKLVQDGMITKEEGASAYDEIYGMQIANNISEGAITLPHNKTPYSNLAEQRKTLVEQAKNLEGPGKERVQKKIEALDAQLEALIVKDEGEIKTELEKEKEKSPNLVTTEEARASLEQENEIKTRSGKGAIIRLTDEAIETRRQELNKEKQDAIQKPSTEKVDVQKPTKDSGKVGKGDASGDITTEGKKKDQVTPKKTAQEEVKTKALPKKPLPTRKERVSKIVSNVINKTKARKVGTDTNPQIIADNVIGYLQGSKLYEESTDSEREAIIQDINKKLGLQISSPSVNKVLGKKRKKLSKVDEAAALKDQIKLEVKAAKDSKLDQTKRRKALASALTSLKKAGNITTAKLNALLNKVSNVNLNNAVKVNEVIEFMEKAMNDANYSKKSLEAQRKRAKIKKDARKKSVEGTLSDAAKQFGEINPLMVSNIDEYLEKAEKILKGLKSTRITKTGVKIAPTFDITKADAYSKKTLDAQKQKIFELQKQSFQDLTGLDTKDLTLEEMKEALYEIDGKIMSPEAQEEMLKEKAKIIDKAIKNAFANIKINIKGNIASGELVLTPKIKILINNFLTMDLSKLSTKQKMEALDAIINFETNSEATGGMEAIWSQYKGNQGMFTAMREGIKSALDSSWIGRKWIKELATLPNAFDLIFKSQSKARTIRRLMGVDGLVNGSADAQTEIDVITKDYAKVFVKKGMKNGIYFDENNEVERGILAEVRTTVQGTESEQQKEFERRKRLVKETYEKLLESKNTDNQQKGELIKTSYEKILDNSKNINDVESKVDPINLEGVKYITDIWASKYDELYDISLNVYNKNLGKNINYTPESHQKLQTEEETPDITEPVFNPDGIRRSPYDKKTGVLMEATKPSSLSKNRVLNLSFDSQNLHNLKAAMTDIYTAPSIQQIKGAQQSEAYKKVFVNDESRALLEQRIIKLVDIKRGNKKFDRENKLALRRLNRVAAFGVVKALGGLMQPLKQMVPIFNTLINAGLSNTLLGSQAILTKEANEALNNSGLPIANRGIQAQVDIESLNSKMEKVAKTRLGKGIQAMDALNKNILKYTLVKSDVLTARASFLAYYYTAMEKKGVKPGDIDWTKPLNKKAAQFAMDQVDRQQNISDQDLQGNLFTSQKFTPQLIRKMLFPFANFLLNQKTRMYADINTLWRNPTANPGDKITAIKSLGGLGIETLTFNTLGYGISQMLSTIAQGLMGEDEDDEKEARRQKNLLQGRVGNMISDIVSPLPILNEVILQAGNVALGIMQTEEDDPFLFFAHTDKTLIDQMGVLGIGIKKAKLLWNMIQLARTGTHEGRYMGRNYEATISKNAQTQMESVAVVYFLHLLGILPFTEIGYMSERVLKEAQKSRKKKPIKIIPPKEKKKTSSNKRNVPVSPFKNRRRKKTGPSSPF